MKIQLTLCLVLALMIFSCGSKRMESSNTPIASDLSKVETSKTDFLQFEPKHVEGITLEGYEIDIAYEVDSFLIFSAYSDGDLTTSDTPVNWGDRLVQMKDGSILFQSKPVGDPYEYTPNFYRNSENGKVIIVCQLGNEDHYGGEAFLLEKGNIHFIGNIEIENPFDLPNNNSLIDILKITEKDRSIYFEFNSDTLLYLGDEEWQEVINDGIYYKYSNSRFKLIGL